MSNNQKHEKMNVQFNIKTTRNDNQFTILARKFNDNSTIVGRYPSLDIAKKCASDFLDLVSNGTSQPSGWNRITEIVIVGTKIK